MTDNDNANPPCCVHAYVSGRVQGVSFRAFTRQQALQHDVAGWAKNLPDGRVEVMLQGLPDNVHRVLDALRQGPPHAQVTDLWQTDVAPQSLQGFSIG